MTQPKNLSFRYLELDVLRGFAAVSVLCFHFTSSYAGTHDVPFTSMLFHFVLGSNGVDLFFMISGFVILITLDHSSCITDFSGV